MKISFALHDLWPVTPSNAENAIAVGKLMLMVGLGMLVAIAIAKRYRDRKQAPSGTTAKTRP